MINETAKVMRFYADERGASRLYAHLAGSEKDPALRGRFAELARVENLHIAFWRAFLLKRGITTAEPSWFSFAWARLLRRILGTRHYLSLLQITETTAVDSYYDFLNSATLEEAEKTDITRIIEDELGHEEELESQFNALPKDCLLYTSDAADDLLCVDLGGRRIIKKKKKKINNMCI